MTDRKTDNLEKTLIEKCQQGDSHAFAALVNSHRKNVLTYFWRNCGSTSEAEDMLQETLIKVWRALPRYRYEYRFTVWLFGIARNVLIDHLRRKKTRSVVRFTDEVPEQMETANPAFTLEAAEIQEKLEAAIERLPEKQREIFLLRQHSEMSFKEIAESTGQPLNTVLGHMHYAVKKLQIILREEHAISK